MVKLQRDFYIYLLIKCCRYYVVIFYCILVFVDQEKKDLNIVFGDKKYEMDMVYFLVNFMIKDRFKYLNSNLICCIYVSIFRILFKYMYFVNILIF